MRSRSLKYDLFYSSLLKKAFFDCRISLSLIACNALPEIHSRNKMRINVWLLINNRGHTSPEEGC